MRHGGNAEDRGDPGRGHGRLQPSRRRRRGSHAGSAPGLEERSDRSRDRRASRTNRQTDRRRQPHRVPQRGRRGALRDRRAERPHRAQRRPAAGTPHRVPRRHPFRRRGRGERRRSDGRRGQYRRAARRRLRAGRDLSLRTGVLAGQGRLDLAAADLGPTQLKNIAEPVRVYSLQVGVPAQAKPATPSLPRRKSVWR